MPDWRLRGPSGDLHAGYVAGLTAQGRPAEVTLRRPVPVEGSPEVLLCEGALVTRAGEHSWLRAAQARPARPADLDVVPHALPTLAEALVACASRGVVPPVQGCSVCGPMGMRLRMGPLDEARVVAGVWVPAPGQCGEGGLAPTGLAWAVLSCAALSATRHLLPPAAHPSPWRCTGVVHSPISAGHPHVVVAWPEPAFGATRSTALLMDPRGEVCALLRQTTPQPRRARSSDVDRGMPAA